MALTETEITAGAAYTVRIDRSALSGKRFSDAVALVKGIDGQRADYVYDPQDPAALATGYVRNEDPETATATYSGTSRAWTVTIPAAGGRALSDLRAAVTAYGAAVTAGQDDASAPAAPRRPRSSETERVSRLYGTDMAEYGSGFSPEERRAFGGPDA